MSLFNVDTWISLLFYPLKSRDSFPKYKTTELRSTSVVSSFTFKLSSKDIFRNTKIVVRTTTRLSKSPISAIYVFYNYRSSINHLVFYIKSIVKLVYFAYLLYIWCICKPSNILFITYNAPAYPLKLSYGIDCWDHIRLVYKLSSSLLYRLGKRSKLSIDARPLFDRFNFPG